MKMNETIHHQQQRQVPNIYVNTFNSSFINNICNFYYDLFLAK